jgi:NAD(P)H-dependent nitrite reductase small subunit
VGKPKGESRGLEFLKQARPAAVEHLLSFFAESARHLDPKTRFLISVVTKVVNGSERGLRQYAKRALESGAAPDEVIDAVLCAYPCAGLTKVVDAIDVLLDMSINGISLERPPAPAARSEGQPESEPSGAPRAAAAPSPEGETPEESGSEEPEGERTWVPAGQLADLPAIGGRRVIAGTQDIALFSVEGEVLAVDNRCPHKGGSLSEGVVLGGVVTCPLHHWRFDLRSGGCPDRPRVVVRTYPVRVEGDRIFVGV